MYVPMLRRRPLGEDLGIPIVNPTPWVIGAAVLVGLVFVARRRRA